MISWQLEEMGMKCLVHLKRLVNLGTDEALVNYIESQPNGTVGKEYTSSAGRIVIYNTIEEVPKDDERVKIAFR